MELRTQEMHSAPRAHAGPCAAGPHAVCSGAARSEGNVATCRMAIHVRAAHHAAFELFFSSFLSPFFFSFFLSESSDTFMMLP